MNQKSGHCEYQHTLFITYLSDLHAPMKKIAESAYDVAGGNELLEVLGNMGAVTVDLLALGGGAVPHSQLQMERSQVSLKVVGHVITHFSQTDPSNAVLVLEVE